MSANALRDLFSESEKSRFARTYKAQEVPAEKIQPAASTESDTNRKKKDRKRKRDDSDPKESIPINQNRALSTKTLFVGNVPISENVKSITKMFQAYGAVESVRLRSVPIAGAKVDDAGNQDLVRKVCVNSKKFGEQKGSLNAYVVFKEDSSVESALEANNTVVGGRHIRVDRDVPSLFDHRLTLFIGALPHYADEEELREHFAKVSSPTSNF
jgi:nucleolar protein 12